MSKTADVNVVIDKREPVPDLLTSLEDNDQVSDVGVDTLPTADIVIGIGQAEQSKIPENGVAFERKTPSDFASSVTDSDEHLKDQVERMAEQFEHSYVLVEGDLDEFDQLRHTNVPSQALRGMAASVTARFECPVIFCSDQDKLIDMALRIARKHIEDPNSSLRVKSSVSGNDAPTLKRMYGCIDGVGSETADNMYEHLPTLQDAAEASMSELQQIDGIGERRAKNIKRQLQNHGARETTI